MRATQRVAGWRYRLVVDVDGAIARRHGDTIAGGGAGVVVGAVPTGDAPTARWAGGQADRCPTTYWPVEQPLEFAGLATGSLPEPLCVRLSV